LWIAADWRGATAFVVEYRLLSTIAEHVRRGVRRFGTFGQLQGE
jgi:hypothetical protein